MPGIEIEVLSKDEHELVRYHALGVGKKALRIIDAQAAVIERVRANAAEIHESLEDILDALAAAPEHTAPDVEVILTRVRRDVIDIQARDLAAANTRVAELRAELDAERERTAEERTLRISDIADANARVAELEARRLHVEREWLEKWTAANARVAELEEMLQDADSALHDELRAANARVAELERLHEQALSERDAAHLSLESMTAGRDSALELAADISDQRDAANAQVAELEAQNAALHVAGLAAADLANKAHARADAAERALSEEQDRHLKSLSDWESESAALRLQIVELQNQVEGAELAENREKDRADAAERGRDDANRRERELEGELDRAESEAASLRAAVRKEERLELVACQEADELRAQLAAANALLERVRKNHTGTKVWEDIDAHLSGQAPARTEPTPVPMVLHCPECRTRHIDEGEFATKVHHTHSCQGCGLTWRPAVVPTVGVKFLPGFKNEASARTDQEVAIPAPSQRVSGRFCTDHERAVMAIGEAVLEMRVPNDLGGGFYFDEMARSKLGKLCDAAELARREGSR